MSRGLFPLETYPSLKIGVFLARYCRMKDARHPSKLARLMLQRIQKALEHAAVDAARGAGQPTTFRDSAESHDPMAAFLLGGHSAKSIHRAIVLARDELLQRLIQSDQDAAKRHNVMLAVLRHHDRLLSKLIQADEEQHRRQMAGISEKLMHEGHKRLRSQARIGWMQEQSVIVFNYFKEMPVRAVLRLLEIREYGLITERSAELIPVLAAGDHGRFVFTRMPEMSLSLRLKLESATKGAIHWHDAGIIQEERERRSEPRVRSDREISVLLNDTKGGSYKGSLYDISASGLGFASHEELPFVSGDSIRFRLHLAGHDLKGNMHLAWIRTTTGRTRLGGAVEPEPTTHRCLKQEVMRLQNLLLGELKLRGIPDSLMESG